MAQYTQLTSQEIHQLAQRYNLTVISHTALEGGAANSSFLMETARGQYIMTIADDKSISDVTNLASLLHHLAQFKFPTLRLMPADNGEFVTSFKSKAVLVKGYIPGRTIFQIPDSGLFALGKVLGQLHAILAPEFVPHELPYGQAFFSNAYGLGADSSYETWLACQQEDFLTGCPDGLPKSLVHGDVAWDNIIYLDGEFQALIDFEDVCYYYSVYDLGSAVSGTCFEADGTLNLIKAAHLVAGYQSVRTLTQDEKSALHLFTRYAVVALSFWRYLKYNLHNPSEEKKFLHTQKMALAEHIQVIPPGLFEQVFEPVGGPPNP